MTPGEPDRVHAHAIARPHHLACVDLTSGRRFVYDEFDREIARACFHLQKDLRLKKGARLAWLGKNSADMMIAQLACGRMGAIFVPLNWRLTTAELGALISDCLPEVLVYSEDFSEKAPHLAREGLCILRQEDFQSSICAAPQMPFPAGVDLEAPATLLYTSGTSGKPKGAIVTGKNFHFGAENFAAANGLGPDSIYLCDMPLFHVAGLQAVARAALFAGATLLISNGFDAERTIARIGDPALRITHYFCVTQMAQMLRRHPAYRASTFRHLQALSTGGSPNPPASVRAWVEDGVPMMDGYGMTECGCCFGMPIGDLELLARKAGSIGFPFQSLEVRIVDDRGRDVPTGEAGELWMKGPNISPSYWDRPQESEQFFAGGWAHTGDMARRDADGFYYILERKKDMYVSGGENVYPAEIEAALCELAEIADAAVIGVPDERWGETGLAYIVAAPGTNLSEDDVRAHCRARLAGYKLPKRVIFTTDLPRTASGKVQKQILRERFKEKKAL